MLVSASRMLVAIYGRGLAFRLRHHHRNDLVHETARLDRGDSATVAAQGELVLLLARDAAPLSDVLAGLAHRVRPMHLGQARVREAPTKGRIEHLAVSAVVRRFGLGHDKRRPGHALDPAGHEGIAVAGHDRVRRTVDRLEPGPAQPIDRLAGNLDRQAGQ